MSIIQPDQNNRNNAYALRPAQPMSLGTLPGKNQESIFASNLAMVGIVLGSLRRSWKRGLLFGLIVAALAAAAVWMFLPQTKPYAYTKLYYPVRASGALKNPDPPVNPLTEREKVTSRTVIKMVVEDPEIAELSMIKEKGDAVAWMLRELTVEFPIGSEIMKLQLADHRPDEAKKIMDKLAKVYIAQYSNSSSAARVDMYNKLKEELEKTKKDYFAEVNRLKKSKGGVVGRPTNIEIQTQRENSLEALISTIQTDINKLQREVKTKKDEENRLNERLAKKPVLPTATELDAAVNQNTALVGLKTQIEVDQLEYTDKLRGLNEEHPTMVQLKNRISRSENTLEAMKKTLGEKLGSTLVETLTDARRKVLDELFKSESELKDKQNELAAKQKNLADLRSGDIGNESISGSSLMTLTKRQEEIEKQLRELEPEINAPAGVRELEKEAVIMRPSDAARRMKFAAMAGIAFFGMVFVLVGVLELRAQRISSPELLTTALGLRLMGTVPVAPKRPGGLNDKEWQSILNESVDSTRTLFLHSAGLNNLRTVMVSSAVPGEGKTSITCRLAASLAKSGRRTLLIDADLRNPSVPDMANVPRGPGVCEILRGEIPVTAGIVSTSQENLWCLPAGVCDRRSIASLSQDGFTRLLAEIQSSGFDFILIDSSPLLPVADSLLVARGVDGVLLSVMCDVSQMDHVNAACQKLAAIDVPLLGAIVSGAKGNSYGYGPQYAKALN